jgi:hypothetical protein
MGGNTFTERQWCGPFSPDWARGTFSSCIAVPPVHSWALGVGETKPKKKMTSWEKEKLGRPRPPPSWPPIDSLSLGLSFESVIYELRNTNKFSPVGSLDCSVLTSFDPKRSEKRTAYATICSFNLTLNCRDDNGEGFWWWYLMEHIHNN